MIEFHFNGSGKYQLPINPEKLTIKRSGSNQRTEVVMLGEINILRNAKLASIAFNFILPGDDNYPFIVGPWKKPEAFTKYFDGLLNNGRSTRFTVTDIGINQRVSVEDFSYDRAGGDSKSLKCSISLLEYRSHGARILTVPTSPAILPKIAAAARPVDKPQSKTHTVKAGESFWAIAARELGDGSRWNEIAQLNGMTVNSVIHPGDVLKLPSK